MKTEQTEQIKPWEIPGTIEKTIFDALKPLSAKCKEKSMHGGCIGYVSATVHRSYDGVFHFSVTAAPDQISIGRCTISELSSALDKIDPTKDRLEKLKAEQAWIQSEIEKLEASNQNQNGNQKSN